MTLAAPVPVINDISLEQLYNNNPCPVYERLKKGAPVAPLAAANLHLATHFEDIKFIDTLNIPGQQLQFPTAQGNRTQNDTQG